MRKPVLIAAAAGLAASLSTAAAAQDATGPGALQVTREDCARLVEHQARNDVNYQPGVDVYGRKVAPADLNAAPNVLPETISIDLTVDLFDRFGIPVDPDLFEGTARIGTVAITGNRVYLNGQPVGQAESDGLATICKERFR